MNNKNQYNKQFTFKANLKSSANFTKGVSIFAFFIAIIYFYFIERITNLYFLAGISLFAAALPFLSRWLRSLVGGIKSITLCDDHVVLEQKNTTSSILWQDVKHVEFETINNTPWLTIKTNQEKTQRAVLENFSEEEQQMIFELIAGEVPDKTQQKSTWIIANRIPFTIISKSPTKSDLA